MLFVSIQSGLAYDYEEEIDGVTAYFTFNNEDRTLNLVGLSDKNIKSFDVPAKASNGLKISAVSLEGYFFDSITIPNGVTSIKLKGCTSLTSVVIPNSVTSIGESAFEDCTSLTSVVIPNSVTDIGESAFKGCTSLTSIDLPNSVTSIGRGVFCRTGLTSIVIPNSVTSIGHGAFQGCTSLTSVVDLPNSVTSIASFYVGCTSLTSVVIPNSVTDISHSFEGCTSLTSVVIPNSVTDITSAFKGCTSLTSVVIPNSVTCIFNDPFKGCTSLTSVVIPNSVTSIDYSFEYCNNLVSVKMYGENPPKCIVKSAFGKQGVMFVLYVPVGTKDKYRNYTYTPNTYGKSYYPYRDYYIEEFDPEEDPFDSNNDVKTIVADEYDGVIDVYNMYGVKVLSTYKKDEIDNLQKGIYVVKVGQKTDKYIVK